MARFQTNTKSKDYLKDKEAFFKELKQFNESRKEPTKTPYVNGVEIDLFHFYMLVQQRGGLSRVNQNDGWDSMLRQLKLPHPCINGSTLLRRLYGTHLEKFDRAKGPPGRDDDMDTDDDPRRTTRGGGGFPRVLFSGAYVSGEHLRSGNRYGGPVERLSLSLLSPMPNEQDFAINVCTVLAADNSNRLPLGTTPHILDLLLAHAGVYNHSSLRETIGRSYYEARGRYPHEFWQLRAGGGGARELADENKFMNPGLEQPELMVQAMAAENTLKDVLNQDGDEEMAVVEKLFDEEPLEDWVTEPSDEDQLFAPELPGGAYCVYTQRVLQIASIVRSLSFHDENVSLLAKNTTLIRFLLLCANSWVGTLRQSGLDTLGNISTDLIIKDPATCLISRHILSTIQSALVSPDRARILAALELLNKLSQNEANEMALLRSLESKVYEDVCQLLTIRDIMALVCTLDCIYALTSLGDKASEAVARVPGLIHTLVSLVTVEAQSYGPRACILMRVVETVSGPAAATVQDQQQQVQQAQIQQQAAPVQQQAAPPPAPVPAPAPQPQATPQQQQAPPTAAPAPQPAAPASSLQQSHLQQRTVQENEHFALAWLRSSFEPLPVNDNSAFDAAELYRQYLACCTKLGRKGVIAPLHFPRLVRTVFGGTVGPNNVTLTTGETQQVYIGIRSRNQQSRPNQPGGPASPILKAQLTNKTAEVKPATLQTQVQQQPHPALTQALEPGASSTSLIKHLLAHKVTQRQQNQQQKVLVQPAANVIVQPSSMEVDPEALIKCTTITPGGVASTTPASDKIILKTEEIVSPKEEIQIQMDEQAQFTIKSTQNKMLADLLEKKSNPPVQVVQMAPQINAPTIQITETGQIVQVKSDSSPVIQINAESNVMQQGGQYFQIKNEQGQLIQMKNDQGQIIQLKTDQVMTPVIQSMIQGQSNKPEKDQIVDTVKTDHSYTEPPTKKIKVDDKKDSDVPQESVSKTAANLYAALAASALEDEEDLMVPKQEPVQQPVLVADNAPVIIQEPILQVQQPTLQVQPVLQVQPMDVHNMIASQSQQIIIQEKPTATQTIMQQPVQIIATPTTSQGGISYITQSIPQNMMQKTIIIVQGPTGGGPLTLTVNNPAGLDEATLNNLIAQATEAITQQQIIQNTGQMVSQQPIITSQPQANKTQIVQNQGQIVQSQGQIVQSQGQIVSSQGSIVQSQGQIVHNQQQIVVTNAGNQGKVVTTPKTVHRSVKTTAAESKSTIIQTVTKTNPSNPLVRQVITRQPVMVGNTKIGEKEVVVTQTITPPTTPTNTITEKVATVQQPADTVTQTASSAADDTPWICHWRGCGKVFNNAGEVYTHAANTHCPRVADGAAPCLWLDCDRVARKTFALLNHLTDKHCSPQALQAMFKARRHAAAEAESKPANVGYPPNAALAALNKHAADMFNPRELMDENEGPVTKSIRLTAALILRNIVIYSNTGRRQLRSYESHLSTIALSSVEASRTIAQVLYDMHNI